VVGVANSCGSDAELELGLARWFWSRVGSFVVLMDRRYAVEPVMVFEPVRMSLIVSDK
jgi:hypothetical protein